MTICMLKQIHKLRQLWGNPKSSCNKKNVTPCSSPYQHQTKAHKGRIHPLIPFLPPDPDDPTLGTVRNELIELGSEKKKK
jgi:hypothetical protein